MPRHSKSKKRYSRRNRKTQRRRRRNTYRGRGGASVNFSNYMPVGTINPSVMIPQNYIPFNQNVSVIPYPLSTTNTPLP